MAYLDVKLYWITASHGLVVVYLPVPRYGLCRVRLGSAYDFLLGISLVFHFFRFLQASSRFSTQLLTLLSSIGYSRTQFLMSCNLLA